MGDVTFCGCSRRASHISCLFIHLTLPPLPCQQCPGIRTELCSTLKARYPGRSLKRSKERVLTEVELKLLAIAGMRVSLIVLASFTLT